MYRKILLTHDGSDVAECAIAHAVNVAKASGAPVVVAQAVDSVAQMMMKMTPLAEPVPTGDLTVEIAEDAAAGQRTAAQENLDRVAAALKAGGVADVSTVIIEGPAGDAILEAAKSEGADIIVMATHGRSGLGRALLGSVADHVVRNSVNEAVLLVRPPQD